MLSVPTQKVIIQKNNINYYNLKTKTFFPVDSIKYIYLCVIVEQKSRKLNSYNIRLCERVQKGLNMYIFLYFKLSLK